MSLHARGILILVLVTMLWGTTFALVKQATQTLSPSELTALRFSIGFLPFVPFVFSRAARADRTLWRDGLILGVLNFASYMAQAIGLTLISSNRSAFITGLNVVMVPLLLALLFRRRLGLPAWSGAVLALLGIGILSADGGSAGLSSGDLWTLGCALAYAVYIVYLERSSQHPPLALAGIQMLIVAVLGWLWSAPDVLQQGLHIPLELWPTLLYLAIFATAGTTLLMAIGQRNVSASEAALIYALEPVFAALFAWIWIGETVGARGLWGGALIVLAMVLSQLPDRRTPPQLSQVSKDQPSD